MKTPTHTPLSTRGTLTFLAENSPPPVYRPSVGGAEARLDLSGVYEEHECDVLDGRQLPDTFRLDEQGFQLVQQPTAVTDIYDETQRRSLHDPECEALVTEATGAVKTHIFDHTLRSGDAQRREEKGIREPTAVIHNDYTPRSGPQRVRDIMGEEAENLLRNPFAIINVWRPIRPVESYPLAMCDARTATPPMLVRSERRAKDRIGEIFMARFHPAQRWIYFPDMQVDEALLIKTFDSREDGRTRWCIHTALEDHNTAPDAAPRESIETRVFAFFDA